MYRGVALSGAQGSLMDSTINSNFLYTSPPQKYKTAATVHPLRLQALY
jgi:hypothetical protein